MWAPTMDSRSQRFLARMRRQSWPALILVTAVAAEAGNVYYYWEPDDLPGCDERAVRHQLREMLERGAGGAASTPVKFAKMREVDAEPAGDPEAARRCSAEATVGGTTGSIVYEITPGESGGEHLITLHRP